MLAVWVCVFFYAGLYFVFNITSAAQPEIRTRLSNRSRQLNRERVVFRLRTGLDNNCTTAPHELRFSNALMAQHCLGALLAVGGLTGARAIACDWRG